MKKILALFLVLATVLSLMTVGAYAAADNALSVSCKLYDGYTVVTVQKSGTVYYTTDGSKPTSKSKKLNSTRIKVSEPCRVRLVSYVKGKPVEYLTKKIPVRLRKPTASLSSKGKEYTYVISIPDGASAYITYDGTTPSKSNGDLVQGGMISVPAKKSAKLVCVKKGWRNSKVITVRARGAASDNNKSNDSADETSSFADRGNKTGKQAAHRQRSEQIHGLQQAVRRCTDPRQGAYGILLAHPPRWQQLLHGAEGGKY